MYKPVMDTLVDGFSDVPDRATRAGRKPRVVHGFGVRKFKTLMARMLPSDQRGRSRDSWPHPLLQDGDVFVWIGPVGSDVPPWRALRERGVRTVYYQTEPADGCMAGQSDAHEVWEFSWHNFDACRPRLAPGLTLRYVPLGYHAPSAQEVAATRAAALTPPLGRDAELIFFGYPFYKSGRGACYAKLAKALGSRLNATWSIWTAQDFEAWWRSSGQWAVHLNLHKSCERAHNPVVFRTALLLSRGGSVLSEHSYARDEAEYAGLVQFGKVSELPAKLDAIIGAAAGMVAAGAGARPAGAPRALQTHEDIAKLYAQRFAPRRIFERARLYDDLLLPLSLRNTSATFDTPTTVVVGAPREHRGRGPPHQRLAERLAVRRGKGGGGKGGGGKGGGGKGGGGKGGGGKVGKAALAAAALADALAEEYSKEQKVAASFGSAGEMERRSYQSTEPPTFAQFALLLHGRIGTIGAAPSIALATRGLSAREYATPIAAAAASHIEHIVLANARRPRAAGKTPSACRRGIGSARRLSCALQSDGGVDVFAHSWNPPAGRFFDSEYGVHLRASLHEPLEFRDREKPRSQALSIGRAAKLMGAHEAERKAPYAFCLIIRSDLLVGAPILLRDFDHTKVWFAEHCCMNEASDEATKAIVRAKCAPKTAAAGVAVGDAKAGGRSDARYAKVLTGSFTYRKRVLGPCRVTQYGGYWGLQYQREDYYYALMDWWFAARPEVARSWIDISEQWPLYKKRLQKMHIARWFSHYLWAIHVHDFINVTDAVRFKPGVRVNLVRHSFPRLRMPPGKTVSLGEYDSDAVGNCETLNTLDNRSISTEALLRTPVQPHSTLGKLFAGRYMPMAEQCSLARLEDPVVCCGEPRRCGVHSCGSEHTRANVRFWKAGQTAISRVDALAHKLLLLKNMQGR